MGNGPGAGRGSRVSQPCTIRMQRAGNRQPTPVPADLAALWRMKRRDSGHLGTMLHARRAGCGRGAHHASEGGERRHAAAGDASVCSAATGAGGAVLGGVGVPVRGAGFSSLHAARPSGTDGARQLASPREWRGDLGKEWRGFFPPPSAGEGAPRRVRSTRTGAGEGTPFPDNAEPFEGRPLDQRRRCPSPGSLRSPPSPAEGGGGNPRSSRPGRLPEGLAAGGVTACVSVRTMPQAKPDRGRKRLRETPLSAAAAPPGRRLGPPRRPGCSRSARRDGR